MKKNISSAQLLQDFNINYLDLFEQQQYDHLIRQSTKCQALQIWLLYTTSHKPIPKSLGICPAPLPLCAEMS